MSKFTHLHLKRVIVDSNGEHVCSSSRVVDLPYPVLEEDRFDDHRDDISQFVRDNYPGWFPIAIISKRVTK